MKPLRFTLKYAGVTAIPAYIAFTWASHLQNRSINPVENWLSDYGNPLMNPTGAVYYNAGCVVVALLLAIFYAGMVRWWWHAERKYIVSYVIAQVSGLVGSAFLILTTVFPLGVQTEVHSAFSTAHMIAMDFFLSFTAIGLLLNRSIPKAIGVFGFLASIFNIVTMNAFNNFYLSEWLFFLLFMVYMILITWQYDRLLPKFRANEKGNRQAAG